MPSDRVQALFDDVAARFEADAESRAYLRSHRLRYGILFDLAGREVERGGPTPVRVLDVGPSYETEVMRRLWANAHIDSLGFEDLRLMAPRSGERHIEFDLVDATDESKWPSAGPYDLIVFAEVIEHLHISPLRVLELLASLLRPGGTLLLQTPNAAAMSRRFWLLMGKNPFEPIRDDLHQAGHFREYTVSELRRMCEDAGLQPLHADLRNYFVTGSRKNRLLVAFGGLLPPRLRQGITLLVRKP